MANQYPIGNDFLAINTYCKNNYLTFNMLRSPKVEGPELTIGTG